MCVNAVQLQQPACVCNHAADSSQAEEAHLRGAVKSALNVGIHGAVLKAGRPKVNDLDLPRLALQQDILWLQVAVNDLRLPQNTQSVQYLQRQTDRVAIVPCLCVHAFACHVICSQWHA